MKPHDRLTEAQEIASQIHQLQLRLDSLQLSPEEIAKVEPTPPSTSKKPSWASPARRRRPLNSARELVLLAVGEVGFPMLAPDITRYLGARYGFEMSGTRFGSLRKAEMEAFDRGSQRQVWIAYGLTEKGEAVKRLLARSDFPLHERVVSPLSGRRLFFQTTARLCEIALKEADLIEDAGAFNLFVADHARDLPGLERFQKGQFPFEQWLELANAALAGVAERDLQDRKHAALRLTMLDEKYRLFGTEYAADDHTIDPPIQLEKLAR
jgi:hypothetical protein